MANITGRLTINEVELLMVDSDPSAGGGTSAPIGSVAQVSTGQSWVKFGAGNTDWRRLQEGSASGTLGETQGGTGQTTYTTGDILYASSANILTKLPIGTANQILRVSGGLPSWQTLSGSGITDINTLNTTTQFLVTGTSGTDFNISSSVDTHTFNIPDASGTNRGLITTGAQTIAGAKTFSSALTINPTTNQLVLGVTNTTTISATAPSASRTITLPDPGTNASFVLTESAQTINGAKTFSAALRSNTSLILEDPGAGTNTTTLQAGTVSSSYSLTLPTAVAAFDNAALVSNTSGALSYVRLGQSGFTSTVTSAGTVTLTSTSTLNQRFTGSTLGQIVNLGNATTYSNGVSYRIINDSTQMIQVVDNGSNELARIGPSESGQFILEDNGTSNGTWNSRVNRNFNSRLCYYLFDDFISPATTASSTTAGESSWFITATGTASTITSVVTNVTANHPGIAQITKGTTAAGRACLHKGGQTTFFGSGVVVYETLINIQNLSDGTNTYSFRIGYGDDTNNADHVDGVYFEYDSTQSANWRIKTANNSTRTTTNTSTAVATGWTRLRMEVNADGTRVDYFINGTNVGNITTNIPTTAARQVSSNIQVVGSVGTSARNFLIDYVNEEYFFGTARG